MSKTEVVRRVEAAKATVAADKQVNVSPQPSPVFDHAFWRDAQEKCGQGNEEGVRLRSALLEWLRYEAVRLAAQSFTAAKRRECAQELEQIETRAYDCLLKGEWPQPVIAIHAEMPRAVKRVSPITVLRSKRFKILDENQKGFKRRNTRKKIYTERTLIMPDIDDPDPTWPGHLLPTRLCISVSVDIQHTDEALTDSLLRMVQDARRLTIERERADGGGRHTGVASMAEALRLYEQQHRSPSLKKSLEVKTFGADNHPNVTAYRALELAKRMIRAATAGRAVWQKTFR